jgi:hypothetical protein
MKERHSVRIRCSGFWRKALILSAVLSLTINLATRYSRMVRDEGRPTKTVTSRSLDAKRQHLLNDGLHWFAPAAKFVLFEPAGISAAASPSAPSVTGRYSEGCLYDRPPPHC